MLAKARVAGIRTTVVSMCVCVFVAVPSISKKIYNQGYHGLELNVNGLHLI